MLHGPLSGGHPRSADRARPRAGESQSLTSTDKDTSPPRAYRYFFFSLLALVIAAPFTATGFPNGVLTLILVSLVLGLGVWAMWKNPRVRFVALALAIPAVIAWLIDIVDPNNLAVRVLMAFTTLFFGLAIVRVFTRIERLTVVNEDSFYGAASIYLMIGLGYSVVYYTIWKVLPDTFYSSLPGAVSKVNGWHDFVYFSFTTLATVGYGDITPVGPFVRSLAILEVISGVFFVAVIIARLVSLYRR